MRLNFLILTAFLLSTACGPLGGEPAVVRSIQIGKPTFTVERARFSSDLERDSSVSHTMITNSEVDLNSGIVTFIGKMYMHSTYSQDVDCRISRSLTANDLTTLRLKVQALELCRNIIPSSYSAASLAPWGKANYIEGGTNHVDLLQYSQATGSEYISACFDTEIAAISSLLDGNISTNDPLNCN